MAERSAVVDASVLAEYLAPGSAHGDVAPLFDPESRMELWTPDLCLLEVANVLRKRFLTDRRFTRQHLADGVADLLGLGLLIVSSRALVEGAIRFADNLTVYDAAHLVLAAARHNPICTLDTRLAKEARRAGVTVLVPGTDPLIA
ncbi:MAG: type II toxin-antitoxin system VapC family toxin [Actinomycetota bacterium]